MYLSDEILQLGRFFSTSFEIGRLGSGFGSFLSSLPLILGTMTSGGFFVAGGVVVNVRASQSLVPRLLGDTVPKYFARPPLFLCTTGGLRNSDELLATSTDIVSLVFLICRRKDA